MKFSILTLAAGLLTLTPATQGASVTKDGSTYTFHEDNVKGALAIGGVSQDDEHPSHFGVLNIKTTDVDATDKEKMYAAGVLEGALTADRTTESIQNLYCQVNCDGTAPFELTSYLDQQNAWTQQEIQQNMQDPFWQYIDLSLAQWEGLQVGYVQTATDPVDDVKYGFRLTNFVGDLFDILPAVDLSKRPDFSTMSKDEIQLYQAMNGHCSAIVRVADDLSDMFWGHSSWFVYSNMLRYYKNYDFTSLKRDGNKRVSFSSYPGMISSLDDFYMMHDTKLSMVQTTNNVFDTSLYDLVTATSLPAWQRVRAANALATDGEEWYETVKRENSGTYNNQYMVVDLKKFVPGNALEPGTLWVVEQIPGTVVGGDQTEVLQFSYWPSYNVPFFDEIYNKSGYPGVDAQNNNTVGSEYMLAPRAKIFRRDHSTADSIEGLQHILRYNGYNNGDEFADNGFSAICSRGDLNDSPSFAGCYDSKGTSASLMLSESAAWIINGPTAQDQPPFDWSKFDEDPNNPHVGQPDKWDYEWEKVAFPTE